jgi:hypothetical protein
MGCGQLLMYCSMFALKIRPYYKHPLSPASQTCSTWCLAGVHAAYLKSSCSTAGDRIVSSPGTCTPLLLISIAGRSIVPPAPFKLYRLLMYRSILACVLGTTLIHETPDWGPISCPLGLVLLCRKPVVLPALAETYFAVKQLAAIKSREPLRSLF